MFQGRRNECKIGQTIPKEPRPGNYWSDQNPQNVRPDNKSQNFWSD